MIVIAYIFYILAFSRINFSLYLQRSPQTAAVLKYFTCICTAFSCIFDFTVHFRLFVHFRLYRAFSTSSFVTAGTFWVEIGVRNGHFTSSAKFKFVDVESAFCIPASYFVTAETFRGGRLVHSIASNSSKSSQRIFCKFRAV